MPRKITSAEAEVTVVTATGSGLVKTPASGQNLRLLFFQLTNNGAAVNTAGLRFGDSGNIMFDGDLGADGGTRMGNLIGAYPEGLSGAALNVVLGGAGSITVTVITVDVQAP